MSATATVQSRPAPTHGQSQIRSSHNNNQRGRGGKSRGKGRGGRGGAGNGNHITEADGKAVETEKIGDIDNDTSSVDGDVCFICAEPVKYYSLSTCNHRTCHVCALRLRALYKKDVCTFCKEPQPELHITFETQEMMTDSLILLRFNCPDSECDYIAKGWGDLKMHIRASHGRLMCDLCIRSKKVFAHEHILYTYPQLVIHLPSMDYGHGGRRSAKKPSTTVIPPEGGIHPLCEFCRECFFSEDEMYAHMRERHEECFVCKRDGVRDVYFASYPALETHFSTAHHACSHPECLQRKFVVFSSALDLQAHMVDEHGASRKVVGLDFASSSANQGGRNQNQHQSQNSHRGGGGGGRDPPPREQGIPVPPPAPPQNQNQNQSRRRQAFGGALTGDADPNAPTLGTSGPPTRRPSPNPADDDPAISNRHTAFLALLSSLAPNSTTAVQHSARDLIGIVWNVLDRDRETMSDKAKSRGTRDGLEPTARVINSFVDLLEEDEEGEGVEEIDRKSLELLREWKGFEVEQRRQFPDLVPTASSSAGAYAAITSGRVLNAKHSTHTTTGRAGNNASRRVWDRVAQAANSGSASGSGRVPPGVPPPPGSLAAALDEKTPWAGSGSSNTPTNNTNTNNTAPTSSAFPGLVSSSTTTPTSKSISSPAHLRPFSVPAASVKSTHAHAQAPPPKLNAAAFPGLPASTNRREKVQVKGNVSLRNILGSTGEVPASRWGAPSSSTTTGTGTGTGTGVGGGTLPAATPPGPSASDEGDVIGGVGGVGGAEISEPVDGEGGGVNGMGKKGKGKGKSKQKQMLFTLGSFPT
ncbi:hypothetical protein BDP27DRAFT_1343518 [Rhodocollybia butyracea]|uniref:RING-type E3 ubiquitin transferase n=1 Tax=Rhodocollybia butyracea TaxID=206335 RepID=A0A9P5PA09_9AGAR|nr:hypothetical protein BDP27DRAFT_1343518 [Rhodocollybia butyracea]